MTQRDVIIIGAPRSGTNMLRDILTRRSGVVTWPCDEINAVWRHGSRDYPHDEIPSHRADAALQRFLRNRFDKVRRNQGGHTVVEKTCANSLRVDYVAALLPTARFILITRDGIDATASALARWHAPIDWRYTARKARFVPAGDLAHSALRFAKNRVPNGSSRDVQSRTWGPRFNGIDEMMGRCTLEEVCAAQWQRCVELSRAALDRLPAEQVHRVGYEDFVRRPEQGLVAMLEFLQLPATTRSHPWPELRRRASERGAPVSTLPNSAAFKEYCPQHLSIWAMPESSPWSLRQRLVKRLFDLIVAVPALVATSPIIGLATLAARVDTGQTGIFAQQRVGRHGQLFTVYKIRTMRMTGGSTVTTSTDARVTTLGRWLRAFKLDELPQLVNVVRGDMSLVGPRPDVPGFADLLEGEERLVLAVRPGITGPATLQYRHEEGLLASVSDPESYNRDVVYPDKVRLNVDYVLTHSMRMDLRYLTRTLLQLVHRGNGVTKGSR